MAASCGCKFSETGTQILPRTFGRVRSHTKFSMACPCAVGFHVDVQLTHASGLTDGTKLCLHPGVTTEFPSGQLSVQKKCLTFQLAVTAGVDTKATLRFRPTLPMREVLPGTVYTLREESTVQVQTCADTLVLKLVRSADADVEDADGDADADAEDADGDADDHATRVTRIPVASVDRRLKAHHVRHDLTPWAWWW